MGDIRKVSSRATMRGAAREQPALVPPGATYPTRSIHSGHSGTVHTSRTAFRQTIASRRSPDRPGRNAPANSPASSCGDASTREGPAGARRPERWQQLPKTKTNGILGPLHCLFLVFLARHPLLSSQLPSPFSPRPTLQLPASFAHSSPSRLGPIALQIKLGRVVGLATVREPGIRSGRSGDAPTGRVPKDIAMQP